jgi:hypothetical protein
VSLCWGMEWRWWLLFYCPFSVDPLSRLRDHGHAAQDVVAAITSEVDDELPSACC